MSQDSGSNENLPAQEVDLDSIEVDILIICKNQNALSMAASFLTRRGWPTTVITNMGKAVEFVAEKKPDFVLVSYSHSNPAVAKLPELITQTFNLTCIGFVETFDTGSQTRLNNLKLRYKIQGQASGPTIHRTIRKILGERFNVDNGVDGKDELDRASKEAQQSDRQTVAGNSKAEAKNGSSVIVQKSNKGPGGAGPAAIMVKGGSAVASKGRSAADIAESKESEAGDDYDIESSMQRYASDPDSESESGGSFTQQGAAGSTGGSATTSGPSGSKGGKGKVKSSAALEDESSSEGEVVSTGKYTMQKSARRSLKELNRAQQGEAGTSETTEPAVGYDGSPGGPAIVTSGSLVDQLKAKLFGEEGSGAEGSAVETGPEESVASSGPASLLEKAVEQALAKVCKRSDGEEIRPLDRITSVGVIPVDSPGRSGYLVVGVEAEISRQQEFLSAVEGAIRESFESIQVPGKLESAFWLDLPEVNLIEWASICAEFELVMPHSGSEIAVAFFAIEGAMPRPEKTENGMYSISLDQIEINEPVPFKAYLHMKKNQKFFLYLRNGRRLQAAQKDRLKQRAVKEIYMKSVDIENLRSFLAANFLRSSIKKAG
jgi:hypothetical protein